MTLFVSLPDWARCQGCPSHIGKDVNNGLNAPNEVILCPRRKSTCCPGISESLLRPSILLSLAFFSRIAIQFSSELASEMATGILARPLRRTLPLPLRFRSRIVPAIPHMPRRGYSQEDSPRPVAMQDPVSPEGSLSTGNPPWMGPKLEVPPPPGTRAHKTSLVVDRGRTTKNYLYTALRDSCQCHLCVDPHSKQRKIRTTDVPWDITPRRIEYQNDEMLIQWNGDIPGFDESHVSRYDLTTLLRPVNRSRGDITEIRERRTWNNVIMEKFQHWISYQDFMHDDVKFGQTMKFLSATGLIFLKDIPDSREEVAKIATRMGTLRNTFYGSTWDVRSVPKAKNVAYTNQTLDFHMDLMYMHDPPGYQLLHCLENSCEGGESVFADGLHVASYLRRDHPDHFKMLTVSKVPYEYSHENAIYYNEWPVIEVDSLHPYSPPKVKRVNYSPPFQAPMHDHPQWRGKKGRPFRTAFRRLASLLANSRNQFELKLEPGQCVIFENRRVLHSRRPFDTGSGSRWLAGAYLDMDSVLSTFRRVARDQPELNFTNPQEYFPRFGRGVSEAKGNYDRESEEACERDDEGRQGQFL